MMFPHNAFSSVHALLNLFPANKLVTPHSPEDWARAREIARANKLSLSDLAATMAEVQERYQRLTVGELLAQHLASAKLIAWSPLSQETAHRHAQKLAELFRGKSVAELLSDPEPFAQTLRELRNFHGVPYSSATRDGYLGFLKSAVVAGTGVNLPCLSPSGWRQQREAIPLSPGEVRTLMANCRVNEQGILALMLYAALQPSTIRRLRPENFNLPQREIHIPAADHQRGRSVTLRDHHRDCTGEVVSGVSPTLWLWLEARGFTPPPPGGTLLMSRLPNLLRPRPWTSQLLQFTSIAYTCAYYGVQAAANLLNSTNLDRVRNRYAQRVSPATAQEFFELNPVTAPAHLPDRARYPSAEEMQRLLDEVPVSAIAKKMGLSISTVYDWCDRRGLRRPPARYWKRQENKLRGRAAAARLLNTTEEIPS